MYPSSSGTSRTIVLQKTAGREDEYLSGGAVTPGHLVQVTSTNTVVVQSTASGICELVFAKEDPLYAGHSIDTAYVNGDLVPVHIGVPGEVINAFIKAGQNIAEGDQLVASGDGTLKKSTSLASGEVVKMVVGFARQAINLTASGAVATRIPVRLAP